MGVRARSERSGVMKKLAEGSMAVIESPLSGDHVRNFRFLLWCCRALWLVDGIHAVASHMLNPWFMDDTKPDERKAGMNNPWCWGGEQHFVFTDLGESSGMCAAMDRCDEKTIPYLELSLADYAPDCWAAFQRSEWPPHTPGFEIFEGATFAS